MIYKLRYFFDFGSGVCLWSGNDTAHVHFDSYPITSDNLPISYTLQKRIEFLVSWYDTFLDWDNVPNSSRWSNQENNQFRVAAQELLHLLREELGTNFEVIDESGTAAQ